jgi:secreted trypsin-like serine protease
MVYKCLVIFSLLFTSILSSFGGTIDPDTPDSKYIEYGENFNSVVKLCCFDGKGLSCGSAVVIAPEWIVTAAHVVENCNSWTVTIGEEKYGIKKMIMHPSYKPEIFNSNDIAVGKLTKKIDLQHYPNLYTESDEVGKMCSISGWGFTGTFNTGVQKNDNKRRAGYNTVDKIQNNVLVCSPSRRDGKITELEYLICSGDSGGGLFIENKLAGVHSSVAGYDGSSNSSYGDEARHTRVSIYANWINDTIAENTNTR